MGVMKHSCMHLHLYIHLVLAVEKEKEDFAHSFLPWFYDNHLYRYTAACFIYSRHLRPDTTVGPWDQAKK